MRFELPPLQTARSHAQTDRAQRLLTSAYHAVYSIGDWYREALRQTLHELGEFVRSGGQTPIQPPVRDAAAHAQELQRAIVVFAGAGLDAAVKQLLRDALPALLDKSQLAQAKFIEFTERAIEYNSSGGSKALASILASPNPREALVIRYVYYLTGSSLQSAEQLQSAAAALGVSDPGLRKRLAGLRDAFTARNQIVHELDLLLPMEPGDTKRRFRDTEATGRMAHELLDCGQQLLNAVVELLEVE